MTRSLVKLTERRISWGRDFIVTQKPINHCTRKSNLGLLCYLCLVFVMLSRLFIAALWSSEGKGLTSWYLLVIFIVILLLSHLVSWDRCGT